MQGRLHNDLERKVEGTEMSFRASQLYISRATRRMLSVIARAEGGDSTADSVGDRYLSEHIASRHPALAVLQKEIDTVEAKMVEAVKG